MEIRVLGPVRVHHNGREAHVSTPQVRRLLAFLAAWPGEVLESERIMVGLWGTEITEKSRNTLQAHVYQLRKLIGSDRVVNEAGGYRLNVEPHDIDAHAVFGLVHRAGLYVRAGRYAAAHRAYSETLGLFRGPAFGGVDDEEVRARRAEVDELFAICQEERLLCGIELSADRHQLGEQIAQARTLVQRRPERERRWELLIRALAAADRLGEAATSYAEVQHYLRGASGLDPGDSLQHVIELALKRDSRLHPAQWSRPDNVPEGQSPHEYQQRIRPAAAAVRNQLDSAKRALLCVLTDESLHTPLALALGRELRGDFHLGMHLGHLHEVGVRPSTTNAGEYLVIQVGVIPNPQYVQSRLSEAFSAPSFVLVCSAEPILSVALPTITAD